MFKIYLQINSIGLGTSYSSAVANQFLFNCNIQYLIKTDDVYLLAYRYIDDLIILNFDCNFLNNLSGMLGFV